MRLSKGLRFAVELARFAVELGADPLIAATVVHLARLSFAAGVRVANGVRGAEKQSQRRDARLEECVATNLPGWGVHWPGLWPGLYPLGPGAAVRIPNSG
jgi:hypothetical protein